MTKNDEPLIDLLDLARAIALLTRLPVPIAHSKRTAQAAWAYPLVGVLTGGLSALIGLLALFIGLTPAISALLVLATSIILTGALHEDGLADSADGLWGGWDKARRLDIMKDSQIGTYGVLALIFSVGLRWSALTVLLQQDGAAVAIIAAGVLSRAAMPTLMTALPHARESGLSRSVGSVSRATAGLAVALAAILAVLLLGISALPALLIVIVTTLVVAQIARAKIGGQTGDILGAAQQCCEIAVLLVLAA